MGEKAVAVGPRPNSRQERQLAQQFERAQQALRQGSYDYAVSLLLRCCQADPANLLFRQTLRQAERTHYANNLAGHGLAWLTTLWPKFRLWLAYRRGKYLQVLEHGELVLTQNPWDTGVQLHMAQAADKQGLTTVAIWVLEQARQTDPCDPYLNRVLAELYEKCGNFPQALALWDMVCQVLPGDEKARRKRKDLAAKQTIEQGRYEEPAPDGEPPSTEDGASANAEPNHAGQGEPVSVRIRRLREQIAAQPEQANGYSQLAELLRRQGLREQARAVLGAGLRATGGDAALAVALPEIDLEIAQHQLAQVREAAKTRPHDRELAGAHSRCVQDVQAQELRLCRARVAHQPANLSCRYELGVQLLRAGQVDEAIVEFQVARDSPRYKVHTLVQLGHCFRKRSNWRLARCNYEEALLLLRRKKDELLKEVLFELADGYATAGDMTKALEMAHELANLDFAYRGIGHRLDEWEGLLEHR